MSPPPALEVVPQPPDGGWGWFVVIGAHISIGFAFSMPKSLSIFYQDIQDELGVNSSEIAWITSIMLAVMYAGGPISSVLVNRFGSRPVVMVGGLTCAVSMVSASFGTSIYLLYFLIGVIGGCGLSLNLNASLIIISKYFLVKRPLANGLAMAGSPVFLCILAPVNQCLLDSYGWRGSFLILGALMLNCCVAGALMRPVNEPCKPPSGAPEQRVEGQPDQCNTKPEESCMKNVKGFLDLSLLKDRGFVIYLIGSMMFIFGCYAPILFLPAYSTSRGIDEYYGAYLLSIMGFVDMFIRPGTGFVANSKWIRPKIQYFFSLALIFTGTSNLLCPLLPLVVYTILFAIGFGMVFALIFECLMDLMGSERFPSAVGLVTIIECIPMLLGPPTAGALVDHFGDYEYLYLSCGSVILIGGFFTLFMNIINYHMLKKKKNTTEDTEQNLENIKNQDQVSASEAGMRETPEVAMEGTEPEAKEKNGAQSDPRPENAETQT